MALAGRDRSRHPVAGVAQDHHHTYESTSTKAKAAVIVELYPQLGAPVPEPIWSVLYPASFPFFGEFGITGTRR